MVRPFLFPMRIPTTMRFFGRRFSLSRLVFSSNKNATTIMMMMLFCVLFVSPKGNDVRVRMLTRRVSLSSVALT